MCLVHERYGSNSYGASETAQENTSHLRDIVVTPPRQTIQIDPNKITPSAFNRMLARHEHEYTSFARRVKTRPRTTVDHCQDMFATNLATNFLRFVPTLTNPRLPLNNKGLNPLSLL